ncbi:MAG: V-type ATP synthase subunit F [Candidatus Thermoplasmatota archaeon]
MKVVVIGKKDMAVGFSLAGVNEVFTPENDYEAKKRLDKLIETPDVGVILLSESIAEEIRKDLKQKKKKKDDIYPVIVEIPDKEGPVEGKEDPLQDKIKRAVGIDINTQEEK